MTQKNPTTAWQAPQDKLWDRLRNLLNEPAPDQDVLICFHRVITLGFVGKYRQTNAPEREQIIELLNTQLPAYALSNDLPLVMKPKPRIWLAMGIVSTVCNRHRARYDSSRFHQLTRIVHKAYFRWRIGNSLFL